MLALVGITHREDRAFIAASLVSMGEPAVRQLSEILNGDTGPARCTAALALGLLGHPDAVTTLVDLLTNRNIYIKRCSAEILCSKFNDTRGVPVLAEALGDHDQEVREEAVVALRSLEDTVTVPPLLSALSDRAQEVRRLAAYGLNNLGDSKTLPLLVLLATSLTPAEKLTTLEVMRNVRFRHRKTIISYPLPEIDKYCRGYIGEGNGDVAVRACATAVLAEKENRTHSELLLRVSDRDSAHSGSDLLRAASGDQSTFPANQHLRPSENNPDTIPTNSDHKP